MTQMHPIVARFHNEPALVSEGSHNLFASLLLAAPVVAAVLARARRAR